MTDHVVTAVADGILAIHLNRPEKKNALTVAMYAGMADALERADADGSVRVVTLTGTADSFTSGNDIADFMQQRPTSGETPVLRFLRLVSTTRKPLIAAVNGLAVGVGVTMLLHCDLAYAADSATFQLPFVSLGLVPEAASTLLLPRLVGHQRACELLLLGEKFDAASAREIGLVNAVHPAAALAGAVQERAQLLAGKPPSAVRLTKALLRSESTGVAERMIEEGRHFASQLQSPEAREAFAAFMERRKPDFSKAL
ncbi:MAG TPA: enoyl-CoA hydratase [Xanthobacteraceae bacterium]|nr:enoyl-CoA hydratase [Xanthobacteraceae bacterium]